MRKSRIVLIVLILAAAGYGLWARPWVSEPPVVATETVAQGPAAEVLAVNGQIKARDKVTLAAPVVGQIAEVLVAEGALVEKGQLLLRLDDNIAQATVAQAEASLQSARLDAESKKRAWDRAEALGGTISARSLEDARFAYEEAAARVNQLTAALEQARQQLALYRVTAPLSGTVLSIDAEVGQVVGSSSAMLTLGNLADPMVETDIDEVYGVRIRPGLSARVAAVGTTEWIPAEVDFVAPTVDPVTGGRKVRLRLTGNMVDPMPSGLTVSVNVVVAEFDQAITLPRGAILSMDRDPRVLVVVGDRVEERPITFRPWPSDRLIVTDGLAPGDRVILDPQSIAPGMQVRVRAEG